MIMMTVYRNNGKIVAFELSGHADSGPYGYDLVCAGVSAVSFGTINAIIKLARIEPKLEQGVDGGYLCFRLPNQIDGKQQEIASCLLEGMLVSMETIEREYSQFIQIQTK